MAKSRKVRITELMEFLDYTEEEAIELVNKQDGKGTTQAVKHKEAELVLLTLENPRSVETIKCWNCDQLFQTDYHYNRHCSDSCLKESLLKKGLDWNPDKQPEDRWQGVPPGVVRPETLSKLHDWAIRILDTTVDPPTATGFISIEVKEEEFDFEAMLNL